MQKIVGEVFLYDIALVPAANHKIVNAVMRISLHDMPQDRLTSDLDHGFGANRSFLTNSRSQASGKDNCFHFLLQGKWNFVATLFKKACFFASVKSATTNFFTILFRFILACQLSLSIAFEGSPSKFSTSVGRKLQGLF